MCKELNSHNGNLHARGFLEDGCSILHLLIMHIFFRCSRAPLYLEIFSSSMVLKNVGEDSKDPEVSGAFLVPSVICLAVNLGRDHVL